MSTNHLAILGCKHYDRIVPSFQKKLSLFKNLIKSDYKNYKNNRIVIDNYDNAVMF